MLRDDAENELGRRALELGIDIPEYLGGIDMDDYVKLTNDERDEFDRVVRGRLAAAAAPPPPPPAPGGGARTRRKNKTKRQRTRRRH